MCSRTTVDATNLQSIFQELPTSIDKPMKTPSTSCNITLYEDRHGTISVHRASNQSNGSAKLCSMYIDMKATCRPAIILTVINYTVCINY